MSADDARSKQDELESLLEFAQGQAPQATTAPQGPKTVPHTAASNSAASVSRADDKSDDVEFLLAQAEAALASIDSPQESQVSGLHAYELPELGGSPASSDHATLDLLNDVELDLRIELGRTQMHLEHVLQLRRGSVVTLDKLAGDPVDIYANGRMIARGEVLVLNDNFCVRVAELISGDEPATED